MSHPRDLQTCDRTSFQQGTHTVWVTTSGMWCGRNVCHVKGNSRDTKGSRTSRESRALRDSYCMEKHFCRSRTRYKDSRERSQAVSISLLPCVYPVPLYPLMPISHHFCLAAIPLHKSDTHFEFECSYFEELVISHPNNDFLYQRIIQSWVASISSPYHPMNHVGAVTSLAQPIANSSRLFLKTFNLGPGVPGF